MEKSKHFRKRGAILACLRGTTCHPDAEWIFDRLRPEFPDLSLGTVYRNLALFKQEGLIASLGTVDGVERFDGNTAPHVHFVCRCCGNVVDLPGLAPGPELLGAAQMCCGKVEGYRLLFDGVCDECLEKS